MLRELGFFNQMRVCAGAEVNITADGSFSIRMVKLSLRKKLVFIDSKLQYQATSEQILKDPIRDPLAITLTGKGILIKKVQRMQVITEQNLQHLFPNLKLAEFYVQHFVSGEHSFVSIVRIEVADAVLEAFRKQGAEVSLLSLGPFVADGILNQLNVYDGNINFHGHQISLNKDRDWLDYKYSAGMNTRFTVKVDIETIPEEMVLAYATAFQLLLNESLDLVEVENSVIKEGLIELTASRKFKRNKVLVLASFFALLLINFLVFSTYNSLNEELLGRAGQQTDFSLHKDKLIADVAQKEQLVKDLGWNKGHRYAFLCDQIGQTTPQSVILTSLTINTIPERNLTAVKKDKLEPFSIRVEGQTTSVYVINDWIDELKQKAWVKKVQLEKYKADDQQGKQVFTILLNY